MTFNVNPLTSIHGRRLGLGTTGAIMAEHAGVMSAAVTETSAGLRSDAVAQTGVAVGTTLSNFGRQSISSATATAQTFEIAAPVAGIEKEILVGTSASEITLGSPTTAIVFKPAVAGAGSTMFLSAVNLAGTVIKMRGISGSQWSVIGSTTALTIG
jgi:hypothetical protein